MVEIHLSTISEIQCTRVKPFKTNQYTDAISCIYIPRNKGFAKVNCFFGFKLSIGERWWIADAGL